MGAKILLDEDILQQLQEIGEARVEDARGVPIVVMTIDTRQQLHRIIYDDGDLTEQELMSLGADQLDDPTGWGAPGMEIYDTMEATDSDSNGNS